MHENNPLHTFTTAVHVSVVAFAMNARYPGQFPNCSERQTRRMKERELDDRRATRTANLIERERQRERWRRLENGGKGRRRERKLFSAMLRALQKHTVSLSLSLHSTFIFLLLDQHPPPLCSLSLLPFATCATASNGSNAPASQHGPAPSPCITVSPRSSRSSRVAPGIQLPITRLHGAKKRELGILCQRFPLSMSLRASLPLTSITSVPVLESREFSTMLENRWIVYIKYRRDRLYIYIYRFCRVSLLYTGEGEDSSKRVIVSNFSRFFFFYKMIKKSSTGQRSRSRI